jgi:MFS family permease
MTASIKIPTMFRALNSRNFRLFFTGQGLSLIGTWMTRVATSWLIYRLTGSALLLGTLGFASQLPSFLLAPLAGVLVDRWDRQRVMVVTQTLSMIQSFALAGLTLTNRINVPEVVGLGVMQGIINAFDTPARQSFVIRMVDRKEDLSNAIALNSSMVNSARIIGPSLAGLLIAAVGIGWCFFCDGVSYLAVIASLLLMRFAGSDATKASGRGALNEFIDGFRYVAGLRSVSRILVLLTIMSLVAMPYTVLLPIFAAQVLHGGPHTLGFLWTAVGVGALIGAFRLAARSTVLGLSRVIPRAAAIFGIGLIGFAFSHTLWLSILLLVVTGVGFISQLSSSNTLIQTVVDDEKRGRVMSFYTMAVMGTTPFGSLIAGACAHWFGAPATLVGGGICCLLGSIWFAFQLKSIRPELREVYKRLGIIASDEPSQAIELEGGAAHPAESVVNEPSEHTA